MKNYLSDRFIRVNISGPLSKIGVPQGPTLGRLLFIIFIKDFAPLPLKSKLLLYADNATAYLAVRIYERHSLNYVMIQNSNKRLPCF